MVASYVALLLYGLQNMEKRIHWLSLLNVISASDMTLTGMRRILLALVFNVHWSLVTAHQGTILVRFFFFKTLPVVCVRSKPSCNTVSDRGDDFSCCFPVVSCVISSSGRRIK
jgi:uncharacterized membrane protein